MTRADLTKLFLRFLFLFAGTVLSFIGYFLYLFLLPVQITSDILTDISLETSIISAVIGYSFPAAFFLITLPRNGYLAELDRKKFTLPYAIAIASPAMCGILSLLFFLYYRKSADHQKWQFCIGYAFFVSTVVNFIWSFFVILRIVSIHRSKSNPVM
jgi:hypothetical protein